MGTTWIEEMPKAEMHIHLEGAFRWETIRELHPDDLPESPPWLTADTVFPDFDDFRHVFLNIIRPATGTPEQIERHTFEVLEDLARQNVRYAEVITGPGFHTDQGLSFGEVLEPIKRGKERAEAAYSIQSRFMLGLNRHMDRDYVSQQFYEVIEFAGPEGSGLLSGIDLQGDERTSPPEDFVEIFDEARRRGLRLRAHAGELLGAESVKRTIDLLGVEHISHGVSAIEDPALIQRIATEGIYLHVCPTSNVRLGVVNSLKEHPLKVLLESGCRTTINSDDPLLFGATIADEYRNSVENLELTQEQLMQTVLYAFEGALLDEGERQAILQELNRL